MTHAKYIFTDKIRFTGLQEDAKALKSVGIQWPELTCSLWLLDDALAHQFNHMAKDLLTKDASSDRVRITKTCFAPNTYVKSVCWRLNIVKYGKVSFDYPTSGAFQNHANVHSVDLEVTREPSGDLKYAIQLNIVPPDIPGSFYRPEFYTAWLEINVNDKEYNTCRLYTNILNYYDQNSANS